MPPGMKIKNTLNLTELIYVSKFGFFHQHQSDQQYRSAMTFEPEFSDKSVRFTVHETVTFIPRLQ